MKFERDPRKAAANERKHRVSFDEAMTVFADWQSISHNEDLRVLRIVVPRERQLPLVASETGGAKTIVTSVADSDV